MTWVKKAVMKRNKNTPRKPRYFSHTKQYRTLLNTTVRLKCWQHKICRTSKEQKTEDAKTWPRCSLETRAARLNTETVARPFSPTSMRRQHGPAALMTNTTTISAFKIIKNLPKLAAEMNVQRVRWDVFFFFLYSSGWIVCWLKTWTLLWFRFASVSCFDSR